MACFDTLASGYDLFMWPLERALFARLRQRALRDLRPCTFPSLVLEVGVGTGANLPFYPASSRVVAVDASAEMLAVARRRQTHAVVQLSQTDVRHLAFPDATFDEVVGSFLLCNVADPLTVLQEVRRVLRPGGRLFLLEHVRGAHPWVARLTDLLDLPWHAWNRSCHLNRETEATVASAGFAITRSERYALGIVQLIEAMHVAELPPIDLGPRFSILLQRPEGKAEPKAQQRDCQQAIGPLKAYRLPSPHRGLKGAGSGSADYIVAVPQGVGDDGDQEQLQSLPGTAAEPTPQTQSVVGHRSVLPQGGQQVQSYPQGKAKSL
jgi:phosphatidylethanolamine/phosphatidyl-N-methylethanolamine N-methyltransferase